MGDSGRRQRRSLHNVLIVDQGALQSVLNEVQAQHGSQEKAGEALGITQETFSKLLKGDQGSMTFRTYANIMEGLGGHAPDFGKPDEPIPFAADPGAYEGETPEGWEKRKAAEAEYELLLARATGTEVVNRQAERQAQAEARANRIETFRSSVLTEDEHHVWQMYHGWLKKEVEALQPRVASVFEELWANQEYKRFFQGFLEGIGRGSDLPPVEDLRCWLALYRAVRPLTVKEESWGVERTWQEMDEAGELIDYLKSALKLEQLMLKPPRDLERVKRASPPLSYREYMNNFFSQIAFFEDNPSATIQDWNALVEEDEAGNET